MVKQACGIVKNPRTFMSLHFGIGDQHFVNSGVLTRLITSVWIIVLAVPAVARLVTILCIRVVLMSRATCRAALLQIIFDRTLGQRSKSSPALARSNAIGAGDTHGSRTTVPTRRGREPRLACIA